MIQQTGLTKPPEESRDRGEKHLDIDTRGTDRCPMPLVGKQPGIADIDVQAGCQNQKHHAHLVTLSAKAFAGQAVPELMHDLGCPQDQGQPAQFPVCAASRTNYTITARLHNLLRSLYSGPATPRTDQTAPLHICTALRQLYSC